jgi:hypothetical protein
MTSDRRQHQAKRYGSLVRFPACGGAMQHELVNALKETLASKDSIG